MAKTVYFHLSKNHEKEIWMWYFTPEAGSPKFQTIEATFDASSILNFLKFRTNIQKIHFELIRNIFTFPVTLI
jgi:hypothetical protein